MVLAFCCVRWCMLINISCSVYYLAGVFARHLQQQLKMDTPDTEEEKLLWKFTDKEVLCAELAGLCHDLGILL